MIWDSQNCLGETGKACGKLSRMYHLGHVMLHLLCNVKQKLKEVGYSQCEVRGESIKDEEWGPRVRSGVEGEEWGGGLGVGT